MIVYNTYICNINSSQFCHHMRYFSDDVKNFIGQFGSSNVIFTIRHHNNSITLCQWSSNFCSQLYNTNKTSECIITEDFLIIIYSSQFTDKSSESYQLVTLGKVSKTISTIAASLYSLKASAFFAICSASAFALASIANASASPLN